MRSPSRVSETRSSMLALSLQSHLAGRRLSDGLASPKKNFYKGNCNFSSRTSSCAASSSRTRALSAACRSSARRAARDKSQSIARGIRLRFNPRAARDRRYSACRSRPFSFNPRAPCDARLLSDFPICAMSAFQSARAVPRATGGGVVSRLPAAVSIRARRAARDASVINHCRSVSTEGVFANVSKTKHSATTRCPYSDVKERKARCLGRTRILSQALVRLWCAQGQTN